MGVTNSAFLLANVATPIDIAYIPMHNAMPIVLSTHAHNQVAKNNIVTGKDRRN